MKAVVANKKNIRPRRLTKYNRTRMTVVMAVAIVFPYIILEYYRDFVQIYLSIQSNIILIVIFIIIDALLYVAVLTLFVSSISYAYKALVEIKTDKNM